MLNASNQMCPLPFRFKCGKSCARWGYVKDFDEILLKTFHQVQFNVFSRLAIRSAFWRFLAVQQRRSAFVPNALPIDGVHSGGQYGSSSGSETWWMFICFRTLLLNLSGRIAADQSGAASACSRHKWLLWPTIYGGCISGQ
jgi:hypothetical protein